MAQEASQEDTTIEKGAEIFQASCASCHGEGGEGKNVLGPSLIGVGAASADFWVSTGRMPLADPDAQALRKEPAYTPGEIDQIVAYVASLDVGPEIPEVDLEGADLSDGQQSFIANCSPCHGATGNGGASGKGSLAPSLYAAEPVTVAEAVLIGPGQMPKFEFTTEERNDVGRFVEYLRERNNPGGADLGGIGPVPEGFVGLGIGLGALVIVALILGKERAKAPGGLES
ncbi:MAG: c-type cytochrome [Actinobacteria bacterium]|nr:c-type cytochrome [Actinomycetota bacterium]